MTEEQEVYEVEEQPINSSSTEIVEVPDPEPGMAEWAIQMVNPVVALGEAEALNELGRRIKKAYTGKVAPTLSECKLVAQTAFAMGANPIAEIEFWITQKTKNDVVTREISIMKGKHYWTRRLNEKIEKSKAKVDESSFVIDDLDERKSICAIDGDLVVKWVVTDVTHSLERGKLIRDLIVAGMTADQAVREAGPQIEYVGYGILSAEEMETADNITYWKDGKKITFKKRNAQRHEEKAGKRGRRIAIERFAGVALGFGGHLGAPDMAKYETSKLPEEIVDGQFEPVGVQELEKKTRPQIEADMGFPMNDEQKAEAAALPKRPWSPAQLKARIDELTKEHAGKPMDQALLKMVFDKCLGTAIASDMDRHGLCEYLGGFRLTTEVTAAQVYAFRDWLRPDPKEGAADQMALDEIAKVIEMLTYPERDSDD